MPTINSFQATLLFDAKAILGEGPVWFVDYRPEIGFGRIQPRSIDPQRDMTPEERHAADVLLRRLTTLPEVAP